MTLDRSRARERRMNGSALTRTRRARRPACGGIERLEDRSLLALVFGGTLGVGANGATGIETTGVAYDSSGSRYLTGSFTGTVDFGGNGAVSNQTSNGFRDGFIAKYDAAGALQRVTTLGGALNDRVASIALDSAGNVYATGYYTGAVSFGAGFNLDSGANPALFVWKLDPSGNTVFAASSTGASTSNQPQAISVDPSGAAIAIGGYFSGSMTLGGKTMVSTGNSDAFAAKVTVSGATPAFAWASQLAASAGGTAIVASVALDPTGNVLAAGQFQGTVDFDPGASVTSRSSSGGSIDSFVEKFQSGNGALAYVSTPTGTGLDAATGVAADSAGNAFVIGAFQQTVTFNVNGSSANLTTPANSSGFFLQRIDANGNTTLARALNARASGAYASSYGAPSIKVNGNGTVAVALSFTESAGQPGVPSPTSAGGTDILIETLDAQGNVIQLTTAGGAGDDYAYGVALDAFGKVTVNGTYSGPANFGSTVLPNKYVSFIGINIFATTLPAKPVVPGDFLGQGYTQVAVYRPSTSQWFVRAQNGTVSTLPVFGLSNVDLPVPADFNGDGVTEQATYNPTAATWWTPGAAPGTAVTLGQFGWPGHDVPVPADYDGIGRAEIAIYRPETAQWFVQSPGGGRVMATFGWPGHDLPVPADYMGLGFAQIAVYRPETAQWFVRKPDGSALILSNFGWPGNDVPVPGDYNGTGQAVQAIYRPATGQWFVAGSASNYATFGWPTPNGAARLNDYPALARTGTLRGLPIFGSGGTISSASRSAAVIIAPAPYAPGAEPAKLVTPQATRPAPLAVPGPSRRPWRGRPARATG